MNRKTHEVVNSPEFDKDSDEPDGYDDREFHIEEHDNPIVIRSKKSESPIGISLSEIIEGEEDGDEEEEQEADATNDLNAGETPPPKTRKHAPEEEEFNTSHFFIKICMYGIILSAWGLIVFYLNLPLEQGILGVQGSEWVTTFLGVMSIVCFYQSSNASNVNPTQKTPPYATVSNSNFCEFCQKWKPERTHHCRSCGQCILRMDHHCFWICNCVGYRNHKAFLLFCFYTGIGSLYFDYRAIYFFIWEASHQSIFDFSAYFLIFLLVCAFIVLPVGLMALGLAVYHFVLAMNNLTTLETLSGINIINPFHIKNLKPKKHINKYDNGILANLSEFFGHSYLLWWWPTIRTIYHEGQVFDQIKEPLQKTDDPKNELRDYQYINKLKPNDLKEIDIEQILRQAEDYTKDKDLEFDVDAIDKEKEQIEQQLKGPEMKDPYIPRRKSFHETEEALRIIQNMKETSDTIYYDDEFDEFEREEAKDISKRTGTLGKERPKDLSISTASQASVEERRKKE